MDTLKVKKIVAVCFLEAVKLALDHLGSHRMSLADHGAGGSGDLPRVYGEVRRFRDYLQRCAAAYTDIAEIELNREDTALLVACCRRYIEALDARLAGPDVRDAKERQFLVKKQQLIADWVVELAEKPLFELPLPRVCDLQGDGARAVKLRVQQKLFAAGPQSFIRQGQITRFGADGFGGAGEGPSRSGAAQGIAPLVGDPVDDPLDGPVDAAADRSAPAAVDIDLTAAALATAVGRAEPRTAPILASEAIRDPRLRALVALDVRSFSLAQRGGDHRMATVLMASILESAILDYAIPRSAELELEGPPESWDPLQILLSVLSDQTSANDRSSAFQLLGSRLLLNPAKQLATPMVATAASVASFQTFLQGLLRRLGYLARSSADRESPASAGSAAHP